MKISQFNELTEFVSSEYLKMTETYNVQRPSEDFLKFIETTLVKYTKLYDLPLYRLEKLSVRIMYIIQKQELKIDKAFATMPHGWIWKMFHGDLWKKMKLRDESLQKKSDKFIKKSEGKKEKKVKTAVPAVVVTPVSPPVPPDDIEVT